MHNVVYSIQYRNKNVVTVGYKIVEMAEVKNMWKKTYNEWYKEEENRRRWKKKMVKENITLKLISWFIFSIFFIHTVYMYIRKDNFKSILHISLYSSILILYFRSKTYIFCANRNRIFESSLLSVRFDVMIFIIFCYIVIRMKWQIREK